MSIACHGPCFIVFFFFLTGLTVGIGFFIWSLSIYLFFVLGELVGLVGFFHPDHICNYENDGRTVG